MTVSIDWTTVDQPPVRLSLRPVPGGYMVTDQHGHNITLTPISITVALRFMQALARNKDAVIDDASVERATWHSVRVPDGLSELAGKQNAPRQGSAGESDAASRGCEAYAASSESPSNVVPIRKGA